MKRSSFLPTKKKKKNNDNSKFCFAQHYHVIGHLTGVHLNGQTKGFNSQVQKLEVHFNFVLTILYEERSMTVTTK